MRCPGVQTLPFRSLSRNLLYGVIAIISFAAPRLSAQNLTLEGQTGGFITPTAYVVYSAKDQFCSHPAVGFL